MFLRPSLVLFTITQAALTGAAARGTDVLTAPPAFQPTGAPSPALSYTLSCPGCQTIPIITTDNIYTTTIWCGLPCSTVYFTGTTTATTIQTEYRQCGGIGWEGPTICESPYTCETSRAWMKEYDSPMFRPRDRSTITSDDMRAFLQIEIQPFGLRRPRRLLNPRPRIKGDIQIFCRVTADLQFVNVIVKLPMGSSTWRGPRAEQPV
ncbi:hypothetical protein K438DRAFT_2101422 [Mycena galopus ATCC 62051]|nr:hypothetical protein K438DRAFT_2101422 [Mycena galopus ATCC 62051]